MKQLLHGKLTTGIGVLSIVGLILLLGSATEVSAQFRMGPQLEPEQAQAAWTLAARGVANELGLSKEATSKLIDAYKAARESYQKVMQGMMRGGGMGGGGGMQGMMGGGGGRGAFQGLIATEQGKLEKALKGFLSDKQAAKAMESLGTFSSESDRFLDVLAGFNLDEENLYKALTLVCTFVVESSKAMSAAMANQDFQSMRTVRQTHKAALDGGLSKILTTSQLIAWYRATASRMRGGPMGG